MSNEWREWLEDRKIEAWTDLGKIADLFDTDDIDDFDRIDEVRRILEEGGWI